MKNIELYHHPKYDTEAYTEAAPGVYRWKNMYVTTLAFDQEPEFGEESEMGSISPCPLEGILDKFFVFITDFYRGENSVPTNHRILEFSSPSINAINNLLTIAGKHVTGTYAAGEDEEEETVVITIE